MRLGADVENVAIERTSMTDGGRTIVAEGRYNGLIGAMGSRWTRSSCTSGRSRAAR